MARWMRMPAAVAVALAIAPAPATASGAGATPAQIAPCGLPDLPTARCGSVQVPLDRADPALGSTRVAFTLIRRADAGAPATGTVAYNPGGPGAATIAQAPVLAGAFAPLLTAGHDLLLVDPRGTGDSDAISCRAFGDPGIAFAPRGRFVAAIGACGTELGARAGRYGSAAVADDFEAVRAALGIDRLDLWGESYGTYLMPVYAARYPARVRSIVLSGAYPIAFDPWGRDRLGAARRAIRLVCARTRACRGGAVLRDIARLAARLRRAPVSFPVVAGTRRLRLRLDEGTLAALVYAGGDAALYGRLPGAVAAAREGDLAPLRRVAENARLRFMAQLFVPDVKRFFSIAQGLATQCHDYPRPYAFSDPPPARRAALARALAVIPRRDFAPFSPAAWLEAGFESPDLCLAWPADAMAATPFPPGTPLPDVPVLVLSGDLDANTPSLAGRQSASQFPRATWMEIPNAGHTPAGSSACAAALAMRFVTTRTARGPACEGTGTPPPVAPRAPVRMADLRLVRGPGTRAQRRALALVVATANDMGEQAELLEVYRRLRALRGGRYVLGSGGRVRLAGARVVRGASVSGLLAVTPRRVTGALRLRGTGTLRGRLRLRLEIGSGQGRAAGRLDGQRVRLRFRFPRTSAAA